MLESMEPVGNAGTEKIRKDIGEIMIGRKFDFELTDEIKEILHEIHKGNLSILDSLPESLKSDGNFWFAVVLEKDDLLNKVPKTLSNYKDIALCSVFQCGLNLEDASIEMKNDEDVVVKAIEENIEALKFASDEKRKDRIILEMAIRLDERAGIHMHDDIRNDENFMMSMAEKNRAILKYLPSSLKNNEDYILSLMEINGANIRYASNKLKNNLSFIKKAHTKSPRDVEYIFDCDSYEEIQSKLEKLMAA
jgi:hypothetical protein